MTEDEVTAIALTIDCGDDVYTAEGERLGLVTAVEAGYFVVTSGMIHTHDYHIPVSAVARSEAGTVTLAVSKAELAQQGWEQGARPESAG